MGQLLLIVVVAVTVAAVVFGVTVLVSGRDAGLQPAEPDGRALPLPTTRPLQETDLGEVRFDLATRGYRMAQVDQAMRRAAYDIGYKDELIGVLEAEVNALREGRVLDADALRRAREAAQAPATPPAVATEPAKRGWTEFTRPAEDDEIATEPEAAEAAPTSTGEPAADPAAEPVTAPAADVDSSVESAAAPVEAEPLEPAADDRAPETAGADKAAQRAAADRSDADQPTADPQLGDRASADSQLGDRGSADAQLGDRASADSQLGDRGSADPQFGDRGSADQPLGDRGSADQPLGHQAPAGQAAAGQPATEGAGSADPASAEALQPAEEAVAPVKARTPARRTATRTSRPTKRATAAADQGDVGASAEDADSAKQLDEAETSAVVATPTEDAGSARR
ncbi:hypothetical protein DFJ67_2808 [Asanoa ferruginea]|uniref:DivIVA domain-containing protein n=1 Tax=Asanoa ferruginea TaxID=53367 RepID=A0A3D9ZHS0_9ACTN|nr:hypothetical protein DFJ67_2808 [Asanoa ferruginea]